MAAKRKIEWAKNITALCQVLGIERNTYYKWKELSGVPAKRASEFNVTAWRQFIIDNGLKSRRPDVKNETLGDLQRDKLAKQNELLQIDIDVKRGDLLPRGEVQTELTRMIAQFKSVLYTKLEAESPPVLEGQKAAEIQLHLRQALGEAFEQLNGEKWA